MEYGYLDKEVKALVNERDALRAELARATRALECAGFTDHGAQEWKPPIGWGDTGTQRERLIALEDELARVKAESLRVVVDGEACELVELYGHQKFLLHDHGVCEMKNPGQFGSTVDVRVLSTGQVFRSNRHAVDVQPVRLERWEDE